MIEYNDLMHLSHEKAIDYLQLLLGTSENWGTVQVVQILIQQKVALEAKVELYNEFFGLINEPDQFNKV